MTALDNDKLLLARYAQAADAQAFGQIVGRYAALVFGAGYRILGDRARAEEVAQETFYRLLRKPTAVERSLAGWLHRTATQLAIDIVRCGSARQKREADYSRRAQVREPSTWGELAPYIDQALAELPPRYRDLLVEHFLHGRTQQELARQYDTSSATISRHIARGLDHLRERLRRQGVVAALPLGIMLAQGFVEAAPATLLAELGRMSLASGAMAQAAGGAGAAGTLGAGADTAGGAGKLMLLVSSGLALAGVSAVLLWAVARSMQPAAPHEPVPAATAAHEPGEMDAAARELRDRQVRWAAATPLIQIDSPASLDANVIVAFEPPAANRISVAFADGRVEQLEVRDADQRVLRQTGKSIREWMQASRHGAPAEGSP